jgi:hypothetical protein
MAVVNQTVRAPSGLVEATRNIQLPSRLCNAPNRNVGASSIVLSAADRRRELADAFQVQQEGAVFSLFALFIRHAKEKGGMNGYKAFVRRKVERSAQFGHGHSASRQRLRGGRAKRNDKLRLYRRQFTVEPPAASVHLAGIRLLVKPALSARLELEMLHCIGDVGFRAIEASLFKGPVKELAGGTDEGLAGKVFLVTWLFAYEHHGRVAAALAEHCLGGIPVKWAACACFGLAKHRRKTAFGVGVYRHRAATPRGNSFGTKVGLIGIHIQHLADALLSVEQHRRDNRSLRHVVPVMPWHLSGHGLRLQWSRNLARSQCNSRIWSPKLHSNHPQRFLLERLRLDGERIAVDYLNYEGKPVRICLTLNEEGKFAFSECGPWACSKIAA